MLIIDFCCFLSDKYDLSLRCGEELFDAINEQDDTLNKVFKFGPVIESLTSELQDMASFLSLDYKLFHPVL